MKIFALREDAKSSPGKFSKLRMSEMAAISSRLMKKEAIHFTGQLQRKIQT